MLSPFTARFSLGVKRQTALLVCAASACSIIAGTLLAFMRPDAHARVFQRTLTFAERVTYQRAIEDVYWRHRIWPKERPDPKPSLDALISQAQLGKKVADYLRNSQALEDYWRRPITAEQLQAEMGRMAQHTKQPEVLHELFDALGNDPFVIAECLARPVLSERLVTNFYVPDKEPVESSRARAENQIPKVLPVVSANYSLPTIPNAPNGCIDDTWTPTSIANAPAARYDHTAVWTGSDMIVWGGDDFPNYFNTGGRYNASNHSWTAISTTNAPDARAQHTAVWTGSEMIVWGGEWDNGTTLFNTGGRYNPSTDGWTATNIINAPTGRSGHTAVWTGSEMIVWGGFDRNPGWVNTGGRYNPSTDSWTATNIINAPTGRSGHTAVWTGSEMIVWGGFDDNPGWVNTGGRYNPTTDSWTATSTANAPSARQSYTAVWTGSEMIVWGGIDQSYNYSNTGGRYDPSTDSWTATSTANAPSARAYHTAVWSGREMIVCGGAVSGPTDLDNRGSSFPQLSPGPTATATATPIETPPVVTGGRYDPGADSWRATSTTNGPDARYHHTSVWTGSEMIVWGGTTNWVPSLNTGGRYCAQSGPTPTPTPTATPTMTAPPTPTPRVNPTPRSRPTPPPRPTP